MSGEVLRMITRKYTRESTAVFSSSQFVHFSKTFMSLLTESHAFRIRRRNSSLWIGHISFLHSKHSILAFVKASCHLIKCLVTSIWMLLWLSSPVADCASNQCYETSHNQLTTSPSRRVSLALDNITLTSTNFFHRNSSFVQTSDMPTWRLWVGVHDNGLEPWPSAPIWKYKGPLER